MKVSFDDKIMSCDMFEEQFNRTIEGIAAETVSQIAKGESGLKTLFVQRKCNSML